MAPAVTLDAADLSVNAPNKTAPGTRTLLLAPPSVAAHPELLDRIFEAHDRSVTDIQMLDRLDMGLVTLPAATYDTIFLLSDPDGKGAERRPLLSRGPMSKIVAALRPGGKLKSQDGTFGAAESAEKTEAILAGLSAGPDGMLKPGNTEVQSVPLRLQRKANAAGPVPLPINGKRKSLSESAPPAGVGFVDFSDDLDDEIITGEDDELIDEDTLLTEEDKARPVTIPADCLPKAGKRRRACKDCTCGLKEKLEAEDSAKRSAADKAMETLKLGTEDLNEVDFTVQGKVGSCGNCALGDAFRCDGCPYIGLPAFKPGDEVRLLNNDVQL